jgi:hypothetical protein
MNEVTAETERDMSDLKAVYWEPVRTGDYTRDCEAGTIAAKALLARMREDDNPMPFLAAFREACEGGVAGGFEIGFATAIGIATL